MSGGSCATSELATELAEAIRRVHSGLRAIDPALAAEAWSGDEDPLCERERQILQRAGEGRSTVEIAAARIARTRGRL